MTNRNNKKNQKRTTKFVQKIKNSKLVTGTCTFCSVFSRVLEIMIPSGLGLYLILTNTDRIVITVAGFMIAFAIVKLVQLAYTATTKEL